MVFIVFEKHSREYDRWFSRNRVTAENELEAVLSLSIRCSPSLEIGVGSGYFASRIGVTYGLDPALSLLKISRGRGVDVVRGVGEAPPFRKGGFCSIYIIVTICFLDEPEKTLAMIRGLLTNNGYLIVCFIPMDSPWGKYYIMKARGGESVFYSQARFYSRSEVRSLLEKAGYTITNVSSTLTYGPMDKPFREKPRNDDRGSFVCYRAIPGR